MATYNTGKMANGWSFSSSASYRWAQEGYAEGTHYKSISYFLGIEKESIDHSLGFRSLCFRKGKIMVQSEVYDLTGDNI